MTQAHRFLSGLGVLVMPKDAEVCVVRALRGLSEDTLRTRAGTFGEEDLRSLAQRAEQSGFVLVPDRLSSQDAQRLLMRLRDEGCPDDKAPSLWTRMQASLLKKDLASVVSTLSKAPSSLLSFVLSMTLLLGVFAVCVLGFILVLLHTRNLGRPEFWFTQAFAFVFMLLSFFCLWNSVRLASSKPFGTGWRFVRTQMQFAQHAMVSTLVLFSVAYFANAMDLHRTVLMKYEARMILRDYFDRKKDGSEVFTIDMRASQPVSPALPL